MDVIEISDSYPYRLRVAVEINVLPVPKAARTKNIHTWLKHHIGPSNYMFFKQEWGDGCVISTIIFKTAGQLLLAELGLSDFTTILGPDHVAEE